MWGSHAGEDDDVDLLARTFSPEDGDSIFLRNAGIYVPVYTAL
jgi:hypothetical protein